MSDAMDACDHGVPFGPDGSNAFNCWRCRLGSRLWWFTSEGRHYLFSDLPEGPFFAYSLPWHRWYGASKWTVIHCRLRGHPYGVVWFSGGYEPNMDCNNCGDDLG